MDTSNLLRDFVAAMLGFWAITIGAMVVIAFVLETRWLPLSPQKQFLSFIYGDIVLGIAVGIVVAIWRAIPHESAWYNSTLFRVALLIGAILFATWSTWQELNGGIFPKRAILSPTKIYHNAILYVGVGGLVGMMIAEVAFSAPWRSKPVLWPLAFVALACIVRWGMWAYEDTTIPREQRLYKAQFAHIEDWHFIWEVASGKAS